MINTTFKATDFFMIRSPIYSLDIYNDFYNKNKKTYYLAEDKVFREAIQVASNSLFEALETYDYGGENRKEDKILNSLNNYMNRITTRSTPFGLFSSVGWGEFGSANEFKVNNLDSYKKRARVDSQWINKLIAKLEFEEELYRKVEIYTNNLLIVEGDRIKNNYPNKLSKEDDSVTYQEGYSIRYSKNVQIVLDMCKNGCRFNKFYHALCEYYDGLPLEVVYKFVEELIDKQYLITELLPPVNEADYLAYIIRVLDKVNYENGVKPELMQICDLIEKYNNTQVGQGIELYKLIKEKMSAIVENNNYIQVDLVSKNRLILSNSIKSEIEKSVDMLLNLIPSKIDNSSLTEYKKKFLDTYGFNNCISILEVLDEQKGLGSPYKEEYLEKDIKYFREEKIKNYFTRRIEEACISGKDEILIKKEELERFKHEKVSVDDFGKSMEVNFFIKSKSMEALNNNDYQMFIGPNVGSKGAGKTFGRFLDMMDININNKIKEVNILESKIVGDEYELIELIMPSQSDRLGNVTHTVNYRDGELYLIQKGDRSKNLVDIRDVYVAVDNNEKFYLIRKDTGKKIMITTNHMLNSRVGNAVYRFMRDICENRNLDLLSCMQNLNFYNFSYIPRIRCGKLVIIPKTYLLIYEEIFSSDNGEYAEFNIKFDEWRKKFLVPSILYISNDDNRLLLNLDNNLHRKQIYNIIKKNKDKKIIFQEFEGDINKMWSSSNGRSYALEISCPLVRNISKSDTKDKLEEIIKTKNLRSQFKIISEHDERKMILPGKEWIYIKIYHNEARVNELIGNYIYDFARRLTNEEVIKEYFYIRYADPKAHIRLRIKLKEGINWGILLNDINEWCREMLEYGMIQDFSINTYVRELERYGGVDTIKEAESFFCADSSVIGNFIKLKEEKSIDFDEFKFAALNIINFMESISIDYNTQLEFFDHMINKSEYRDDFNKDRKELMYICNSNNDWENLKNSNNGQVIYDLLVKSGNSIKNYFQVIDICDEREELTTSKVQILLSLFHMHCIRLFGTDREKERKTYALVRHTLYSLKYFKSKGKS